MTEDKQTLAKAALDDMPVIPDVFDRSHLKSARLKAMEWAFRNQDIIREALTAMAADVPTTWANPDVVEKTLKDMTCGEFLRLSMAADVPCPACNGNDQNTPCAYPSENMKGCLRDKRLAADVQDDNEVDHALRWLDLHWNNGHYETLRNYILAQRSAPQPKEAVGVDWRS
jgi:hypothetical protein